MDKWCKSEIGKAVDLWYDCVDNNNIRETERNEIKVKNISPVF